MKYLFAGVFLSVFALVSDALAFCPYGGCDQVYIVNEYYMGSWACMGYTKQVWSDGLVTYWYSDIDTLCLINMMLENHP